MATYYLLSNCCHCASELHIQYKKNQSSKEQTRYKLRLTCPSCQTHLVIGNGISSYDEQWLEQVKLPVKESKQAVILPFRQKVA